MDIMDSKVNWDTDGIRDTVEIIETKDIWDTKNF